MPRERLSACIIAQDEEQRLPCALESVSFCDAVIVVDGGSTDRTVEIARRAGASVIENPWPGFPAQRNLAIDAATSDWVLEVDADERVSPELRTSIEALLMAPPPGVGIAVFALRNHFIGRRLCSSAKYPAYRSRLFRRELYRHDESRGVHEGVEPRERPVVLEGDLEHELAATLREALLDTWHYARLESRFVEPSPNFTTYLTGIALRPLAKVAYRMIIDCGWRDGWRGALKISLDAASDALVWAFVLTGRRRGPDIPAKRPTHGVSARHFGRRPNGPAKIVAIAGHGPSAQAATRWLTDLQAQGIDVALISDDAPTDGSRRGGEIPLRTVKRLGPLAVMRALELETQLRTIDGVVPVGRRAGLLAHLVPGTLWPEIPNLDVGLDPAQAAQQVRASLADR